MVVPVDGVQSVSPLLALPVARMDPAVREILGEGVDFLVFVPNY